MYFMSLMKCPSFNPDSILRIKLLCDLHKSSSIYKSYKSVCPCIYGIDEVTLIQLITEEISRCEVIEIETRKWFEKSSDGEQFKLKYEREEEVINRLKCLPNNKFIFKDIGMSWKIELREDILNKINEE